MTRRPFQNIHTIAFTAMLAATLFVTPQYSHAILGECGQPLSNGATPVASDALFILNTAVGLQTCALETCDINGSCTVTASDALQTLNAAVGVPVDLLCNCGSTTTSTTVPDGGGILCSSAQFIAKAGSDLDSGWKGPGHNADIVEGASITLAVLRRCSSDQSVCITDADCTTGTCNLTCNCNGGDTECEITGPTSPSACITDTSITCTTNSDCTSGGNRCVKFFGPPLPLAASGVPACITSYFQSPISGTADSATGEGVATAALRSRVHLGIDIATPCPSCGDQTVAVGDVRTCLGGPHNGDACTVDAVSSDFGGVSADCPPDVTSNVSGVGLNINFQEVTTGAVSATATLQCGFPFDSLHPSTGNGACLNDFSSCDTNADCSGASCGLYCHCGFCDDGGGLDPDLPCFNDANCPQGSTCGSDPQASNLSQAAPNGCESLVCGQVTPEECCTVADGNTACPSPTGLDGECNGNPTTCSQNNDCVVGGNGNECVLTPRSCFDGTIGRTGVAAPLGSYCFDDPLVGLCTSNDDCAIGECVPDTSEPTTAALFCIPATASSAINSAAGTPGPGAVTFRTGLISCRCGDDVIGCDEECDDGNVINGDGCDQACRIETP